MSHKDGRVVLSAWVEPVLRDYAREAAKADNLEFSRWVERAVRQTMARAPEAKTALRDLAQKWRDRANALTSPETHRRTGYTLPVTEERGRQDQLHACADELEALCDSLV